MLIRKKKRESAEWVPAALVRAYLDRVRQDERDIRFKLFGEQSSPVTAGSAPQIIMSSNDPALAKEMDALRAQLLAADQRSIEFDRLMNALKAEKATLEQKLKDAPAAGAAAANPEAAAVAQKEVAELKAKLQEYEVIEDDLANLKKFQKENEQLKQKLDQYEKGGANLTVVPGGKSEAPTTTTVSGAGEAVAPSMTVVSGGAAPAAAPAEAPKPVAAAPVAEAAPAPETNTNVLQPVTPKVDAAAPVAEAPKPAAAAPVADEKSPKQKEEELLSEFEKMLAS